MNILHVYDSTTDIGGGSQIATLVWVKNLNEFGVQTKLLTTNYNLVKDYGLSREDCIFNDYIQIKVPYNINVSLRLGDELKGKIFKFNPDIIHLHEPTLLAYKILNFAKKERIVVLSSFHTNIMKMKINSFPSSLFIRENGVWNRFYTKFQKKILEESDYVTTPSKYYKELYQQLLNKKVYLLYYPISKRFYCNGEIKTGFPKKKNT